MRGKNDAVATRRQRFNALHDAEAVAIVKTRRRLVHDERVRVLNQRPAEQHQLPFAAGDAHTPARSQRADAKLVQNPLRCVCLLPRGAVKRPELRAEAHQNAVEHRMVERRTVGLRNIRKLCRQRAAGIPDPAPEFLRRVPPHPRDEEFINFLIIHGIPVGRIRDAEIIFLLPLFRGAVEHLRRHPLRQRTGAHSPLHHISQIRASPAAVIVLRVQRLVVKNILNAICSNPLIPNA